MSELDPDARIARLDAALVALEAAAGRVLAADAARADLADSLAIMDDDRQRLAQELDAALARADRLARVSEAVERRLVDASVAIGALAAASEA